ncbi:MAG: hypothetical protein ABL871_08235, partial [Terricaulis sp.]
MSRSFVAASSALALLAACATPPDPSAGIVTATAQQTSDATPAVAFAADDLAPPASASAPSPRARRIVAPIT